MPGLPGGSCLIGSPASQPDPRQRKENEMLLATTQVEDVDRFMESFSTIAE